MNLINTYKNQLNIIAIIFFASILIFFVIKSIYFPLSDFANYFFGSKFFIDGKSLDDIYEGYLFNQMIFEAGYKNIFVNYTPLPPITLLFFIPLTIFEVGIAKIVFNILSAALFFFTMIVLFRRFAIDYQYLFMIPVIFLFPILNNLLFGQVYLLLFSFLVFGYLLYEDDQKIWAALFWSVAILLKIFPALIIAFLLIKREWKQLIYLLIFCFILFLISIFVLDYSVWLKYLFSILPRLMQGEFHDAFTSNFQSMFVFLKNLFVYDAISNPKVVFDSTMLFNILFLVFKALMLSISTFITFKSNKAAILKFSIWLVMSLMIAPYGSNYGLILLILFYFAFINDFRQEKLKLLFMSLLLFFISNLPVQKFLDMPLLLQYSRFYLMLFFIIIIFIFYKVKIEFNYIIPFLLIFSFSLKFEYGKSSYYLPSVKELMIYDYKVLDDRLTYKFWNNHGEQIKTIFINDSIWPDKSLTINQNQIYYKDNQITNSNNRKLKPMRLDDNSIVFLSDENRGVGFYTFRTIKLPVQRTVNK